MKICILNVIHTPFDKRVFHKVGRSLAEHGHSVISIAPSNTPIEETNGIRFTAIPPAKNLAHRLLSVWRLIRLGCREKAEAYLAVEPESWVAALFIKMISGGKVVFDVHEYVPAEFAKFFPSFARPAMTRLTLKFMRLFTRMTDYIILTRNSFEAPFHGLKTPRTVVMNTNHVQPMCSNVPQVIQERYGGGPMLIHQGLFGDVRGSWMLLDAMKIVAKEIPNVKCVILGDYVYGSLEEYRSAVAAAGLEGAFDFIEWVPYEEVPAYIAVSDIGLILFQPGPINHTLAMPHKLFDYMREGVPTIAPRFAVEVRAIMEDAECGLLVDVTQPEAIAAAILKLLREPEEAQRLGANGRRAVERKYNWQEEERRLLEAFEALE